MKISLVFNLKRSDTEEEAEFDSKETIDFIFSQIEELGHQVSCIDDSGSVESLIDDLTRAGPQLVFNLAEGRSGKYREAFFPALYERMRLPYTGSDVAALTITSNKYLANRLMNLLDPWAQIAPTSYFADLNTDLAKFLRDLQGGITYPCIVKPNFEGSSKGITQESVVSEPSQLETAICRQLKKWPEGILVEQFIEGIDVSVPWIEGLGPLEPAVYKYQRPNQGYPIYDRSLKRTDQKLVEAQVPSDLPQIIKDRLKQITEQAVKVFGISGLARADFRVDLSEKAKFLNRYVSFLEMNALPSLAPGDDAETYKALALIGKSPADLFAAVIEAATHKFNLHILK